MKKTALILKGGLPDQYCTLRNVTDEEAIGDFDWHLHDTMN
jgi:hypothetical protein